MTPFETDLKGTFRIWSFQHFLPFQILWLWPRVIVMLWVKCCFIVQEKEKKGKNWEYDVFFSLVEGNMSHHVSYHVLHLCFSGADLTAFDKEPNSSKWLLMIRLAKWTIDTNVHLWEVTRTQHIHVGRLPFTMSVKDFSDDVISWHPVHDDLIAGCFIHSWALYVVLSAKVFDWLILQWSHPIC